MVDFEATIISQFANSPVILQLVTNMNDYVRQDTNFQNFYDFVWNVDTAKGFGLDIWGRIVDVGRNLQVTVTPDNFGFSDDGLKDYEPFDQAPFYNGPPATSTYTLTDDAYRVLILAKALSNISATTSPAINQLLRNLFPGRGRCYVNDLGGMAMRYTFEFYLQPFELAIVSSSGVLPHPAGVSVSVVQVPVGGTFGFIESSAFNPTLGFTFILGSSYIGYGLGTGYAQPFDQGAFL